MIELEMKTNTQLRPKGRHVVDEAISPATRLVVHVEDTVSRGKRNQLRETEIRDRVKLPRDFGADPEPSDVAAKKE